MLPFRDDNDDNDDIREVYSLVENESIVASVKVPNLKKKTCLESLGWLLVSDIDCSCCLLNPFSGTVIPLPHQNTFTEYDEFQTAGLSFFEKMVLSSNPNENSDFVLMVLGGSPRQPAIWRLGDEAWTKIGQHEGSYSDVVHRGNGQYYAFGHPGIVYVFNLSNCDNQIKVEQQIVVRFIHVIPNRPQIYSAIVDGKRVYLLNTIDDSLLLITRPRPNTNVDGIDFVTTKFQVYYLDVVRGTWKEIYTLGCMAVFLGHNSTTFVDASKFAGVVKANHIYFTDDNQAFYASPYRGLCGGYDSGVYNFETGTVEPVYPGEPLLSKVSPSFWITPF